MMRQFAEDSGIYGVHGIISDGTGEDLIDEIADKQLTRDPGVLVLQLLALRGIQVGQNRV